MLEWWDDENPVTYGTTEKNGIFKSVKEEI